MGKGDLKAVVLDIEGCFPNMPKETIRFALRDIINEIQKTTAYKGVLVPARADSRRCHWAKAVDSTKHSYVNLPFQIMLDIIDFSLDFAFVRMPSGQLLQQMQGVPMGDPTSPGMTVGTCAWMEKEWIKSIDPTDRKRFAARRFMDDIMIIYREDPDWDHHRFISDFRRSECYQQPLTLTDGREGVFLENKFWVKKNKIDFTIKNDNEEKNTIWRYHHFYDNTTYEQKRATLVACLRKVQHLSSDPVLMGDAALAKIAEFRRLRYPVSVLCKICSFLGASSGEATWIAVRNALRYDSNGPKAGN